MASASPSVDVREEVKCPICMEYLTDPVTVNCGHNFCRSCITEYCEKWEDLGDLECPLCKARIKKGNFRPNWQLANIAEKIKLSLNLVNQNFCVTHKEILNKFCKDDQELVCLFCERSPKHQSHTIQLLEEAAEECRDKLCSCLEGLRKEREIILALKEGAEKESQDLLGQVEEKKTKTLAVFNQLLQFLEGQKTSLILQLEELKKRIATRREEHMARLVEELSSLEGLIQQMEEKCQQPASELLQGSRKALQRYEEKKALENPVAFPPELTCSIWDFREARPLQEGVMKLLNQVLYQAKVTLDPDTAYCRLILSDDCKGVRQRFGLQSLLASQDLPKNPERFDTSPFVLGKEGFTAGKHFWEVSVESEETWLVGVARKSVRRKGEFHLGPEEGIWAVGKWQGQYQVLNPPNYTPLTLSQELKRIRVTLNCAKRKVAFSSAESGAKFYTYSRASFGGEVVLPFFCVSGSTYLTLST